MKTQLTRPHRPAATGSVVIEMMVVLMLLITLLAYLTLLGRFFWYYDVAQKAAYDGARFLSTATKAELRTPGEGGTEAAVAALARKIVVAEMAEVAPHVFPLYIDVHCDFKTCGNQVPSTVRVSISMNLNDVIFRSFTMSMTGEDGMVISADMTMRYAGT